MAHLEDVGHPGTRPKGLHPLPGGRSVDVDQVARDLIGDPVGFQPPVRSDFHPVDDVVAVFRIQLFNSVGVGLAVAGLRAQRVAHPIGFQQLQPQRVWLIVGGRRPAKQCETVTIGQVGRISDIL